MLAIIPARGGSKGIPRKNITVVGGKPMIVHSIEAALGSGVFSRCIVTTDCPEIAQVAKSAGAEVINRPAALAVDSALLWPAINHVLDTINPWRPEEFVLLQPTSPLRTAHHVREAIQQWHSSKAACVVSVKPSSEHPHKSLRFTDGQLVPFTCVEDLSRPRQELPTILMQNGAIYGVKTELYRKHQSLFIQPALPYIMKVEDSVDVDNPIDLLVCQALFDTRQKLKA